jgi:hypothetical protein
MLSGNRARLAGDYRSSPEIGALADAVMSHVQGSDMGSLRNAWGPYLQDLDAAKVVEQASDLATCRGHIGALTTSIERLSAGDELVRATSAGIADAITRVLNPLGATSDTPDLDASRSRVTYDTYLPWGADEPVELDDDGIIIMQGSPPGTPDDWDEVDDERFISGPFSAPEEIEP